MRIELTSSALLATSIVPTSTLASSVALSKSDEAGAAAPSTKAHRLLQRFKDKHNRRLHQKSNADVGILGSTVPRFLEDDQFEYYCPRDTCPTELCDCADKGGSLEDCTVELQNVCLNGQLSDCVFEGYIAVYQTVYCPFVHCLGDGFRQDQCDCAFYDLYCDRLSHEECMEVVPDTDGGADKKPFFGCDETELKKVCAQASACKIDGDLEGLPDLGTWVATVGAGTKSSASRVWSGGIVTGVVLLTGVLFLGRNL